MGGGHCTQLDGKGSQLTNQGGAGKIGKTTKGVSMPCEEKLGNKVRGALNPRKINKGDGESGGWEAVPGGEKSFVREFVKIISGSEAQGVRSWNGG